LLLLMLLLQLAKVKMVLELKLELLLLLLRQVRIDAPRSRTIESGMACAIFLSELA
jgi:hypothetical protein